MKKYKIDVLLSSGTTSWADTYTLENVTRFFAHEGYYYFETEDGLGHYFPISKSIVRQIKTD